MDIVNPSTSEEDVSKQEDVNGKRSDFGKMDEKSMLYKMKPSNDLLYMYPSKEKDNIIPTKIEDCSKICSMEINMFPEKFSFWRKMKFVNLELTLISPMN